MSTTVPSQINALRLRRVLGGKKAGWQAPRPFGPMGWSLDLHTWPHGVAIIAGRVIVSQAPVPPPEDPDDPRAGDMTEWIHASMSRDGRVPTYAELMLLKEAVWGPKGEAYQIHPPEDRHVNINEHTLHLWGRADGRPILPDMGRFGTI